MTGAASQALRIEGVVKRFGRSAALEGATLEAAEGEERENLNVHGGDPVRVATQPPGDGPCRSAPGL